MIGNWLRLSELLVWKWPYQCCRVTVCFLHFSRLSGWYNYWMLFSPIVKFSTPDLKRCQHIIIIAFIINITENCVFSNITSHFRLCLQYYITVTIWVLQILHSVITYASVLFYNFIITQMLAWIGAGSVVRTGSKQNSPVRL